MSVAYSGIIYFDVTLGIQILGRMLITQMVCVLHNPLTLSGSCRVEVTVISYSHSCDDVEDIYLLVVSNDVSLFWEKLVIAMMFFSW